MCRCDLLLPARLATSHKVQVLKPLQVISTLHYIHYFSLFFTATNYYLF